MLTFCVIVLIVSESTALRCFKCLSSSSNECDKHQQIIECISNKFIRCITVSYTTLALQASIAKIYPHHWNDNKSIESGFEKRCGVEHGALFGCRLHCKPFKRSNASVCKSSCCKDDLCNGIPYPSHSISKQSIVLLIVTGCLLFMAIK